VGDIQAKRAGFEALMATAVVPAGVVVAEGSLGTRPALHVEPAGGADPGGTLLYLHGGAYALGSPRTALALTAHLVVDTGFGAWSLDYRLAPEHPYPAGLDDVVAAYRELLDHGVDPGSVVLAGDSAGGGLCVAALVRFRREGLPVPGGVVGMSAGLDQTRTGPSLETKADLDPIFTRDGLRASGELYRAGADPTTDELLSPAVLADPTGFPPMLRQVGTNEMLLDDSTRMAERARDAGVDVVLDVVAGVPHVFQMFAGVLDEADDALERAALFVRQCVRRGSRRSGPES